MTCAELIRTLRRELTPLYGRSEGEAMLRLIFCSLKGWKPVDIIINEPNEASGYLVAKTEEILARLRRHEPLQYILGEARFYGMDFRVGPGVLIPRPETAELVDMIVDANPARDLRVLDVCTGSGCIAIALDRNLRFPSVTGIDISAQALGYARENARLLKARVRFEQEDVFGYEPRRESLDIIVSNPPYIDMSESRDMEANVLDYEPHQALFVSDDDPLVFYSRIADIARQGLVEEGRLYFEINPRHADAMKGLLEERGFSDVALTRDSQGRLRFASCVKPRR